MDRTVHLLNRGWKFHYGKCEEAWYQGIDDSSFCDVILPHDWAVTQPFSEAYSSGTGYLAAGTGWYRLHFHIPEKYKGKRLSLSFDGVYKNSQVWCNSYYLGKHPNGYTGFSYDITQQACFGEAENVISVKVSHEDISDSRWYTGSGITRKVQLVVQEAVHPAENGIYLVTKKLAGSQAVLLIHHEAVNETDQRQVFQIETELEAEGEAPALRVIKTAELAAGARQTYVWEVRLTQASLWSTEQPFLYQMRSYYRMEDGSRYLADEQRTGIRTFRFDPQHKYRKNL